MEPMPTPTSTPPTTSWRQLMRGRASKCSATHDAATPGSMDSRVRLGSKDTRVQMSKASMPMKCIDQMPPPSAMAPVMMAVWRWKPRSLLRAMPAICRAMNEAKMAMPMENSTSQ